MMWSNAVGWPGWLLMTLTMVGFWALVVFGILALFRGIAKGGDSDRDPDPDADHQAGIITRLSYRA